MQRSASTPAAVSARTASSPRILIRTNLGEKVPYFDVAPLEAAGGDGSYVMERRIIEPGSLGAHTFDEHVLMLPLGGQAIRFDSRLDGRPLAGLIEPGRFRFLARGDSLATSWYAAIDALFLTLSLSLFTQVLGEAAEGRVAILVSRLLPHQDDVLTYMLLALQAYVGGEREGGRLFEQSLVGAIAHRITTTYTAGRRRDTRGPSLPLWKQKRLTEYIQDNIGGEFGLKDLAAVVDMSPYHLTRAFRASTNCGLWRYVLECRARHAIHFISRHPEARLADVAVLCGFESYSQFIAVFRRFHGLLPSEYRRSLSRR